MKFVQKRGCSGNCLFLGEEELQVEDSGVTHEVFGEAVDKQGDGKGQIMTGMWASAF